MYEETQDVETELQDVEGLWDEVDTQAGEQDQPPEEQGEGETPAPEKTDQKTQEEPAQEEQPADQTPETFTLKHLDQVRQVGKEEVVTLAQKGLDYDRIRTERDELRQYRQEADPALELVKGYAQRSGMTIPDYLDFCRKRELMAGGVDEATAAAKVEVEKQQAALQEQTKQVQAEQRRRESEQAKAQERAQARKQDISAFLEAFPEVKPESIPREVWEQVSKGQGLVTAYTMHQNRQLQAQLAAERQNKENQRLSTGSLGNQNEAESGDEIDRWWNET